MATVLKCKMCGGDIEIQEGATVAKCKYCGSMMTIPLIDSDKKARLFNRANEYRLNNEFDKAFAAYKTITDENPEEAEAYWGLVLSEYGVEYVKDPASGNRIPTCHRTILQPIKENTNYKFAYKYADAERKFMYEDEAEQLGKLQKEILSVSAIEAPYDVFICYKESDESGERTEDSVVAENIYDALTERGLRTFFAKISLEEKLGQNYEPYIFAALKSAKVMVHVTTSSEHSNAPWVQNEWRRYLSFMESEHDKVLIPVYQNMIPEALPDEMRVFQAQDMAKIGAMQDLIRGILKIVKPEKPTTAAKSADTTIESLIKRNEILLQSSKWEEAIKCSNRILDADPENGYGYLYIIMAKNRIQNVDGFETLDEIIENDTDFNNMRKFADANLQKVSAIIIKNNERIKERNAERRAKKKKQIQKIFIALAASIAVIAVLAIVLHPLYSAPLAYANAKKLLANGQYEQAVNAFTKLGDYRDSQLQLADALIGNNEFERAISQLKGMDGEDADNLLKKAYYKYGEQIYNSGDYGHAKDLFRDAFDYEDAKEKDLDATYMYACQMFEQENYVGALSQFAYCSQKNYKDSESKKYDTLYILCKQDHGYYYWHLDDFPDSDSRKRELEEYYGEPAQPVSQW